MRRETQNILLILVGGALLKISFTGTYLLYVKPAHQPWLIAGGLIMVTLAAVSIGRDLLAAREDETAGADHHEHDGSDAEHDDHNHSARSAWMLLLPVLAIFLIAPPALGSDSVMRGDNRAAASRASGTDGSSVFPPIPQGDVVSVTMSDFAARAAWDSGNSLNGRNVRLVGFIVVQDTDTFLARLSIACCAADAFPVKVKLDGPGTAGLANDTWIEAVGQVQPGTATKESDYVPTLSITGLAPIAQPENPYEQ
ncbi:TIGR03943 family putative permease subunit [Actinokineospora sp.]|uniref:TIGR03943 family putative permease subunit n=1 Tax=Actinokineospora sp. TaxID=1872133 RepID=UPI0040381B85